MKNHSLGFAGFVNRPSGAGRSLRSLGLPPLRFGALSFARFVLKPSGAGRALRALGSPPLRSGRLNGAALGFASLVVAFLVAVAGPARAVEPLVADLSKHLVAITTGFAGTDVLLFGAVEGEGDVVVVVRGPAQSEVVRRKDRQAGIWVNTGSARMRDIPSFYRVAATRPLDEIAPAPVLERHQIGVEYLDLTVESEDAAADADEYRKALVRLKQKKGLYGRQVDDIGFLGHRLFRTDVHFPANVPVGTYLVEVYLVKDGEVASAQTTPLVISKIGVGADVYDFAHQQAAAYGIIAIALAAGAGWLAAVAFKKG